MSLSIAVPNIMEIQRIQELGTNGYANLFDNDMIMIFDSNNEYEINHEKLNNNEEDIY